MAEPTASASTASAPTLPSTADEVPYVPVSWLAVAAAAAAILLALLLVVMGLLAFRSHRPLLEEELFIPLAALAIVLSFAARRVIRNSEGTRTGTLFGIDLPNAAWWGGLVLGLGYCSYLLAIEFSIDRESKSEVQAWSELILKGDNESLNRAFHRTQDPNERKRMSPTEGDKLEARWGRDYIAFRQCDLVRLAARNPGSKIEVGGLKKWDPKPAGIECIVAATMTCPEGTFLLQIPLRGYDAAPGAETGGRQWQILPSPAGFIDKERARLTPYGWMVAHLTITGADVSRRYIAASMTSREARCAAYLDFFNPPADDVKFYSPITTEGAQARSAVVGFLAGYNFNPGPEFLERPAKKIFKLPGDAAPDEARAKIFANAWDSVGIVKPGDRLRDSTDVNDEVTVTDSAIIYRSPIEIPLSGSRGDTLAARGRVVMICTDPAILAEAKRLRESANPDDSTSTPGEGFSLRTIPWRIDRIESDLKPVKVEAKSMPGTPPPPGGGGAPGGMPGGL